MSEPNHSVEKDRACAEHGDPLIWERGGDDMPTMRGRWYCPTCQKRFMEVLDEIEEADYRQEWRP